MTRAAIAEGLRLIFQGIEYMKDAFPNREFTIDGRLVGDIGEVIAALEYDLVLDEVSRPTHDARTSEGRNVQIKATFKESLTFRSVPDYYLGFKIHPNGNYEVVFNGPGRVIYERYRTRKGIGVELLSFPVAELRKLAEKVPAQDRVPVRE